MSFATKTGKIPQGSDPWAPTSRWNKRVLLASIALIAVILVADFTLGYLLGWLPKPQIRILDTFLFSFLLLFLVYFTIIQVRHYRVGGKARINIGPFTISRRAFEIQQAGFIVAIASAFLVVLGVPIPDEFFRPVFVGGLAVFIVGFAGAFGSSFGSGFVTLGVVLWAGGALYNALAGTDYTRPIIRSVIYAGLGLVAVGTIIFLVHRWRRK